MCEPTTLTLWILMLDFSSVRKNLINWSLLCPTLSDHLGTVFLLQSHHSLSIVHQILPLGFLFICGLSTSVKPWLLPSLSQLIFSIFSSQNSYKSQKFFCVLPPLTSEVLDSFFWDKIIKSVTWPYSSLLLISFIAYPSFLLSPSILIQKCLPTCALFCIPSHLLIFLSFSHVTFILIFSFSLSFYFIPPHYTVLLWYSPLKINNPILYSLYFCGDYFPFLFSFIFIFIYHTVFSSLSSMLRPVSSALNPLHSINSEHSCQNF